MASPASNDENPMLTLFTKVYADLFGLATFAPPVPLPRARAAAR